MAIIVLLEVILKKELHELLKEKNITEFKHIIDLLSSKDSHFKDTFNKDFFDKFVKFIVQFCYLTQFSFDKMNFILKLMERYNSAFYYSSHFFDCFLQRAFEIYFNRCHTDNFSRLLINEQIFEIIDDDFDKIDESHENEEIQHDILSSLKNFPEILENKSFLDSFEVQIVYISIYI